ncbi:hypothetical protein EDB83DRAFT_2320208 [Lactarius deliciosus]|nr:hypothetical protein EDB83DRAFT_2320208 [Lactarius deliciosus]
MFVEGHWQRVKEDYLQHFSLLRLDLLTWVLVTKLAPMYYRKLDIMLNDIGRYRELPRWRRDFKFEWNKAKRTPITMPLNERGTNRTSIDFHFLLCKHLVQRFQPVNPRFFLEVTQNRCLPFWLHPFLKPLPSEEESESGHPVAGGSNGDDKAHVEVYYHRQNTARNEIDDSNFESDDDDDAALIHMEDGREFEKKTYKEKMETHIRLIRDFCNGLKYQIKFQDPQFLKTLEREGAGFLRLAQNCLNCERRMNSCRAGSLSTWEKSTTNAVFYRGHAVITAPETHGDILSNTLRFLTRCRIFSGFFCRNMARIARGSTARWCSHEDEKNERKYNKSYKAAEFVGVELQKASMGEKEECSNVVKFSEPVSPARITHTIDWGMVKGESLEIFDGRENKPTLLHGVTRLYTSCRTTWKRWDVQSIVGGEGDEIVRESWGRSLGWVSALSPSSEPIANPSSTSSSSKISSFCRVSVSGGVADCPPNMTREVSDGGDRGTKGDAVHGRIVGAA